MMTELTWDWVRERRTVELVRQPVAESSQLRESAVCIIAINVLHSQYPQFSPYIMVR